MECTSQNKKKNLKVEKGSIYNFLIVQQKNFYSRSDGSFIKMDKNSVIIINKKFIPRGTRITKPIIKELRKKFIKVVSLACYIL